MPNISTVTLPADKPMGGQRKATSPFRGPRATSRDFQGHVMIDLETMGNRPGCVIVSIGAVYFTCNGLHHEFYVRINPLSCQQFGLHFEANTIEWWLRQEDEARLEISELTKTGADIDDALLQFSRWFNQDADGQACVWGNGSDFDISVILAAYEKCKLPVPWQFWKHRCFRTVKNFKQHGKADCEPERTGTHHNALDDARHQAQWLLNLADQFDLIIK